MSNVARDRIRRCLAMIPLIRKRPGIRIPELASIFGVREQEIWEDISDVLSMCGVPPYLPHNYFVFSVQGDRVSIHFAEHLQRPVHLTLQEALAIDLALRSVSGGRPPAFGDAAPRLRKKLCELLGGTDREALQALDRSVAGAQLTDMVQDTIVLLKDAMSRNASVRVEYYTASRDTVSTRVIEPYGLIDHRGHWYVIARDGLRGIEIPFRVDRIRGAEILSGREYEVPEDFTTEKFRRDEMRVRRPDDMSVRVRFSSHVATRVREEAEKGTIQSVAGGDVIRTYFIDPTRPRWLFTHLARYGADAEVLSPPEVRAEMAAFFDDVLAVQSVAVPKSRAGSRGATSRGATRTARTAAAVSRSKRGKTKRRPRK